MHKKTIITIVLQIVVFIVAVVVACISMVKVGNQEEIVYMKRCNALAFLPGSLAFDNHYVNTDSKGNLYIYGLSGDNFIQKYDSSGNYICSYTVPTRGSDLYLITEQDELVIYSTNDELYVYSKDDELKVIDLTEEEAKEFQETVDTKGYDGSHFLWTVTLNDSTKIKLEKIWSWNFQMGDVFACFALIEMLIMIYAIEKGIYGNTEKR